MSPPIFVAPPSILLPPPEPAAPGGDVADLLRQVVDLQREQIALLKIQIAQHDGLARWRALLARWQTEFPDIGSACKQVLPAVERAYLTMIRELTERVAEGGDDGPGGLDTDFELAEFLDRYGVRLGQLGTVLGQIAPLADAAPAPAPAPEKSG